MTVGDEEPVRRAEPEAGGDGATMHDAGGPLRGELHDLTGTLLDRRLRGAVAADPEPVAVVDGKEARPGDREMARVDDMQRYYRIPADNRDLNYAMYFTDGQKEISVLDDYTSHNTERLTVDGVKALLLKLDFIQRHLRGEDGEIAEI